jgi:hypothetical protein
MNSEDNCPKDIIIPYHTFCGQFWRPSLGFSNTYVLANRSPAMPPIAGVEHGGTINGCNVASQAMDVDIYRITFSSNIKGVYIYIIYIKI